MTQSRIAQVDQRIELVEPGAGEQRHEDGVHERAVVAADEEPVSTAEDET
jgi:hypothetical protein